MKKTNNQRVRAQLQDQKQILEQNIKTELMIQKQIYNSEFILFLYGKTVRELDDLVSKAMNQNFVPVVDGEQCFIGIIKRKISFSI